MARYEMDLHRAENTKRMRKYIRKETKTNRKILEERRDRLQSRIGVFTRLFEDVQNPKLSEADKAKALSICSVYGMLGMLEGIAFLADCVTTKVYLVRRGKDGKKTKTPMRYSVARLATEIADAADMSAGVSLALTRIVRDQVYMALDPEKKNEWYDKENLLSCPHFKETDFIDSKDGEEDDDIPDEDEELEDGEAGTGPEETDEERRARTDSEEHELLDKIAKAYMPKKDSAT